MATTTYFSRSRSPVISIRTQPEDEHTLRAEIEAANRTQHEILPRYSWHSTTKRDSCSTARQTHPLVLPKDAVTRQMAVPSEADLHQKLDDALWISAPPTKNPLAFLKRARESRRGWKRIPKRDLELNHGSTVCARNHGLEHQEQRDRGRRKNIQATVSPEEVVTNQDRAAQHAQFSTWLEEQLEQQNTVADLHLTSTAKSKRTVRRSVYGSITSTKSFFRGQPKTPLERLYDRTGLPVSVAPHLYSFETKDQLREYLNNSSDVSPLSPAEQCPRASNMTKEAGPVELSAGTMLAELEGTSLNGTSKVSGTASRISTPSIRDLPPYNDDKKFRDDMAKEQGSHNAEQVADSEVETEFPIEAMYTCSSCQKKVADHEVYDFCSICDSLNRVLCTNCAARGPCCRHELEGLLRSRTLNEDNSIHSRLQSSLDKRQLSHEFSVATMSVPSKTTRHADTINQSQIDAPSIYCPEPSRSEHLSEGGISHQYLYTKQNMSQLQKGLLIEASTLRREQELVNRERELAVRAREIELRDQQASLREREGIVQQKSDLLMRNLESLVSYQELAKNAFIGAQFQPQRGAEKASPLSSDDKFARKDSMSSPEAIVLDCSESCQRRQSSVRKTVAEAEATIHGLSTQDSHVRTNAAQKRKKEGNNTSNHSTPLPNLASSPEQARKPLSRGNSERDGSQDDEEDGDHRRSPKKTKQEASPPNGPQLLFACPYAKNNPTRFSSRNTAEKNYRGCGTHYLPDVSRLKQHLRRVHWQPETYCPRCYEDFENSAKLTEHAGALVACTVRDCPFPEKMDKTQQERIHVKRPRVQPATVWYDIYKVLFPGQPLPDSPYMDADDPIITPISATPSSDVNFQAIRLLSASFKKRLDQSKDLQSNSLRPLIEQALDDSFKEFLASFTLSPNASPGAGPSIIVSPVSRSSSDTSRRPHSPIITPSRPAKLERQRSVTNVISPPRQVPLLQQPRPPRPKVNTALQVPTDHHRSPSTLSRQESQSDSPIDELFTSSIPPHVRDDTGYSDDCNSFEQGDDRLAMAFINDSTQPSSRNKSVMSFDSGYGSRRHRHDSTLSKPTLAAPAVPDAWSHMDKNYQDISVDPLVPYQGHQRGSLSAPEAAPGSNNDFLPAQPEHSTGGFESYYNFLDPSSQEDMLNGMDFAFFDQSTSWNAG